MLRKRFLAAVASLQEDVDLEALAEALRLQHAQEALRAMRPERWAAAFDQTAAVVPDVFRKAATVTASLLSDQLGTSISFDLTNPRSVQWARTESAQLIVEITDSIREGVQAIIGTSIETGIAPKESARVIRRIVGLTDRQAQAVVTYRFDLLWAGRTGEDVARAADRYATQLLRYRSESISRTETIAAATHGQRETWRQAVDQGLLDPDRTQRVWQTTEDARTCPICEPMDGQEVGLEEPFTDGEGASVDMPPAHPQCRCAVSLSLT